ncbi:cytochrome P450 [Gaertneriomyces semiglobifer]|nr:cytochrome P450 [Gaertneriomyces semiglobifer]
MSASRSPWAPLVDERKMESERGTTKRTATASSTSASPVTITLLVIVITYLKKGALPGPSWIPPLVGWLDKINPNFDGYMKSLNSGDLSVIQVFNRFIVLVSPNDLSRKILSSPTHAEPFLINSMPAILSPDNWVFLQGKAHSDYRRQLNPLFTRTALSSYVPMMDKAFRKHMQEWLSYKGESRPYQNNFRQLNMDSSLKVFCGDYISPETAQKISDMYYEITAALQLVNFPFALPGTKVYKAKQARKFIVAEFMRCCRESRTHVESGGEPTCMMDSWIQTLHQDKLAAEANADQQRKYRQFTDREISLTILTFLFASQDASTSALTWAYKYMGERPDVLNRIRKELIDVRGIDNPEKPFTFEELEKTVYLRSAVREVLRIRPPVLMVPYKVNKPMALRTGYTLPSNSMVIPTFWHSLHDDKVYKNPDEFIPERWMTPTDDPNMSKNFLVFGAGPHACLGKEYAISQVMVAIGRAALSAKWQVRKTEKSDSIVIMSTIYPEDGCILSMQPLEKNDLARLVAKAEA